MANETILVIDDAPVNLKLTNILLRKEGYTVHATADAEQALALLDSTHPDLILVDIQLPGMNGLELTRRIKRNALTRDIVVVALTACAMKGDDAKAFQAGCDGYITKPIETLTLAKKVREYLAKRRVSAAASESPTEPPHAFPAGIVFSVPEMEGIRRRFLEQGMLDSRRLLESVEQNLDVPAALALVHGWVSAAYALDYPELTAFAGDAENLLRTPTPDTAALVDALSNIMIGFAEPPEAAIGPMPDEIAGVLKDKGIALVGCGEEESERLTGALERAGARAQVFDPTKTPDANALGACHGVVVHVRPETLGTHWLHPLTIANLRLPLMLIGLRDHILELEASVVPRAAELLIDGWQPEEALIRLAHLVSHAAIAKPAAPQPTASVSESAARSLPPLPMPREINRNAEILCADDDLTVRMVVRSAITSAGIKCRMACNGNEALQMIRDCRPPAAILDVNMPGMDGYEVLAAVRNEGIPVRIILLTARQQESDITRGFTLGADDYMVKPFNPAELLARVKRFLWQ